MTKILNQFRRIWNDDGREDRKFDVEEAKLRASQQRLLEAAEAVRKVSDEICEALKPNTFH